MGRLAADNGQECLCEDCDDMDSVECDEEGCACCALKGGACDEV